MAMDRSKKLKPQTGKQLSKEQKKNLRSEHMGKAHPAKKETSASVSKSEPPKHEPIDTSEEDIHRAQDISPYLTDGSQEIAVPLSAESILAFHVYAAMLR